MKVREIRPGVTIIENDDLCPRNILLTRALIGNPVTSFRGDGKPDHEIPEGEYLLTEDPDDEP